MKSKILIFLLMLCITMMIAAGSARATPVLLDSVSSTNFYDADKSGGDNKLCWAAAASNVLAWSGWGASNTNPALSDGNNEDLVYSHLRANNSQAKQNLGGIAKDAWQWWFTEPGLGSYTFTDYFKYDELEFGDKNASNYSAYTDDFIQEYIGTGGGTGGYGTVLSIYKYIKTVNDVDIFKNHAITLWGYDDADSDGTLDTIYIADSDDFGDAWRTIGLETGLERGTVTALEDRWYLDGYKSNSFEDWWFIVRLQGLIPYGEPGEEPGPGPGEPVPEPATIFLLGSGLAGLFGIGRRKFMRG